MSEPVIREDVLRVLYSIDFSKALSDEQQDFLVGVSADELALLFEHHGRKAHEAYQLADAVGFMLSMLQPWARDPLGKWRTPREALNRAPRELAESIVRRLGECGITLNYSTGEQ
ncbi:hypothetical protein ABZ647_17735 [Micromonospora aurantiaca]|uniref:hypothetical protein n=1 Tax=Micromonospora aurantiaca (nom. illeg.) TaxID=47850 RepID=UPI00340C50A6